MATSRPKLSKYDVRKLRKCLGLPSTQICEIEAEFADVVFVSFNFDCASNLRQGFEKPNLRS
jgi:hypothetical protein